MQQHYIDRGTPVLNYRCYLRRHSRRCGVGKVSTSDAFVCACVCVCLFVRALTAGKRLQLSTPNLVTYIIAGARHVLTHRSKDQRSRSHCHENRHGAHLLVTMAGNP